MILFFHASSGPTNSHLSLSKYNPGPQGTLQAIKGPIEPPEASFDFLKSPILTTLGKPHMSPLRARLSFQKQGDYLSIQSVHLSIHPPEA